MKYAIVSDLHANESAFRHVLEDARLNGAEEIVCLGDVVGYGPLPAETVALARQNCRVVLAGNHDDAVSGRGDASAFIDLAGDAVERHRAALSSDDLAWLRALPYTCALDGATATHGDIADPPKFYYVEEESDAEANFGATDAQLLFVGHTHVPGLFVVGDSGTVHKVGPQDFTVEPNKRYIVNPGSVGYPREANGECYSSYVLYDSDEQTVTFRFLPFSVASVLQRGKGFRTISKKLVVALVLGVAAVVATAVFLLTPRTVVEVADDPALVVETRALDVAAATRVKANVMLAKGSAPVQLRIVFSDGSANPVATETLTVRKSSAKDFKVPAGAARAEFTLFRATRGDTPAVTLFAPTAK